jgi:hypothetical protein
MLLDVVEAEQTLLLDRLDDASLADAVAAADLGAVGHRCRLAVTLMADVADMRLTEQQMVAHLVDILAVAQQLEVPRPVSGVAVEHAADQAVVLDHQLLVHATAAASLRTISSVSLPPKKSPAENRSMPVTLSLVEVTEPV